jgi:hypothetical protein
MSKIRPRLIGVSAAGTGLFAGLALGVTGLANAASSTTTSPSTSGSASVAGQGHHGKHHGDRDGRGAGDLVTAVSGNTITLDTPSGVETVTVTPASVYKHGQGTALLADVKPNEIVRVRFLDPTAAAPVAKSVRIELARADGYVTAVNGTSFTVIGRDGFARTVQESSTTVYRDAGAAGSPSEVRVGTLVRAEGNLDANGTTLTATRIGTRMPVRLRPGAGTGPASGTGSTTADPENNP